jgi:hypothetical protein
MMTDGRQSCEATRETMGLLIAADSAVPEAAAARHHLATCAACRKYFEKLQNDDRALAEYSAEHARRIDALKVRAINALADPPVRGRATSNWWRWVMATQTRRLTAAAAVAAAVFMVVFLRGPDASFDAWAEVLEKVQQATSAHFRITNLDGGNVDARQVYSARGISHRTFEDGELVEALYVSFEEHELVYLAYPLKVGARMSMDEAMEEDFRRYDPSRTFGFLGQYEQEDLGDRRIDGRSVVGIRVADARFLAERLEHAELELWVDPETRLPVRFDVKGEVAGGSRTKHIRFHDFRWNESVPADEFTPEIPADFDISEGYHLQVDEEHALKGLSQFAEIAGRYPSSLAYESMKVELWKNFDGNRRKIGAMVLKTFQVRLVSSFYGQLLEADSEVVYFGASVQPGDDQRVLWRWKEGEDRYRVVYGDLRTDFVDGQELLRLEAGR